MKYRVVFVDLGGVLIVNKTKEVGEKYDREFGLTKETTRDIFHFLHSNNRTEDDLSKYLQDKGVSLKVWQDFTHDFYNSERRNDELFEKLKKAREGGIKIMITTNNGVGARKIIEKYGVGEIVDGLISSAEIGFVKPQTEYWQAAVDEARRLVPNVPTNEILVIDDSQENCDSAIQYGFSALKYQEGNIFPQV